MKKSLLLLPLTLVACTNYHNSKLDVDMKPSVNVAPIEAKVEVGDKISGSAQCTDLFFMRIASPERKTFGNDSVIDHKAGNLADASCTAGAVYDAMSKSGADVIISPQYTTSQESFGCIFSRCLYRDTKVIVSGWEGKVSYTK